MRAAAEHEARRVATLEEGRNDQMALLGDATNLCAANSLDKDGRNFTYLSGGPLATREAYFIRRASTRRGTSACRCRRSPGRW